MKKNQFPFWGKSFVILMLISFISASFVLAQTTDLLEDKNNDGVSDDIIQQTLNLYYGSYNDIKDTGDVVHYIPTPASNSQGLTWDGNYLWCSDIFTGMIYQVDPENGVVINSFEAPGSSVEGLAWDGTNLWASENGGGPFEPDFIYKIDPTDGSVISSFEPEVVWVHGLTWDGQYLWMIDFSTKEIHKVDPTTGNTLHTIDAPELACIGLTWDGSNLWTDDFQTDKLYCISPEDGSVIFEVNSSHTNPRDLAWDGEYLWVLAAQASTIYQVDIGNTTSIEEPDLSATSIKALSVYPNPMDASTTISYTLKEKENIQLHLFNSGGVLIMTLVNADQAKGDYQFKIDVVNLDSGIYYCELQAGQKSIVKKLIKVD